MPPESRQITSHQIPEAQGAQPATLNNLLALFAMGTPNPGGAHSEYRIFKIHANAQRVLLSHQQTIQFQPGPIDTFGVAGATNEILLAVVIDRLECFQKGPFANPTNETALHHLREAMSALKERTLDRLTRGVEGKYEK